MNNTELLRECHEVLHDLGQIHSSDFALAHELAAARKRITDRGGTLNCIAELMRRVGDAIKAADVPEPAPIKPNAAEPLGDAEIQSAYWERRFIDPTLNHIDGLRDVEKAVLLRARPA